MKALAKLERGPGLTLTRVKKPEVGHNDVMIRIRKTAICGTDIHIWKWDDWAQKTIPVPMHVGHEYVGEIVEMGQEVRGFALGDRVSGEGHITCGFCRNCRAGRRHLCRNTVGVGVNREGAFAEYLVIPAFNAFRIPDDIPDDLASVFDPFGNATHTALSFNLVGEDVLITGAGPIGIMAAAIARHVGARHVVITDVNDYRLALAQRMGATRAVNVMRESLHDVMEDLGMTEGFDVGMEMSGVPEAFHSMLDAHESRRQDRAPRHPAARHGDRLEPGHLQGARDQGHLRARDVRDLVQDGGDAAERARPRADHHAPLRGRGVRDGIRDDALRREREGGSRLGAVSGDAVRVAPGGPRRGAAAATRFIATGRLMLYRIVAAGLSLLRA